ncbi:MAG: pentapeptide repeat-containing protein [Proteobacteria bacterium]|nr:pentapeptide repeat-containing protein [Pseudomonadota bacterium]
MAKKGDKKQSWWRRTENWVIGNPTKTAWLVVLVVGIPFLGFYLWLVVLPLVGGTQSGLAESLYNLALILAAVFGLPILVWRGKAISDQADAANKQAEVANIRAETDNRQARITERGLLQDRYQKGAEMLVNDNLTTRLAGIYALEWIASEHYEYYHMQAIQLLCALIRYAGKPKEQPLFDENSDTIHCYGYVEAAITVIGQRGNEQIKLEKEKNWVLDFERAYLSGIRIYLSNFANAFFLHADLSHAVIEGAIFFEAGLEDVNLLHAHIMDSNFASARIRSANLSHAYIMDSNFASARLISAVLSHASIRGTNLSSADLSRADLSHSHFHNANLTGADLSSTNLSEAYFSDSDFTGANLADADLTGAYLAEVKGLNQAQLDMAKAKKGNPPTLPEGLEWEGEEYDDEAPF